jgi:hypothetical protein
MEGAMAIINFWSGKLLRVELGRARRLGRFLPHARHEPGDRHHVRAATSNTLHGRCFVVEAGSEENRVRN